MDRLDIKRHQIQASLASSRQMGEPLMVVDCMTANPSCIQQDATLLELVRLFHAKEFRHPLVTDDQGRLVGVISDRDVLRCFGPGEYPSEDVLRGVKAADIMSTDVVTIEPAAPLERAVELMFGYGISCLPVVAKERLVGILTSTDLYLVLESALQALRPAPVASPAQTAAYTR